MKYPQMVDLPDYVEFTGSSLDLKEYPSKRFRILEWAGYTLLLKLENSFYSYRDWVASRLFQRMRFNSQSSILLKVPKSLLSRYVNKDEYQQGIIFVEHHAPQPCGPTCDYDKLLDAIDNGNFDRIAKTNFKDTEVLILQSLLPHFFSANEPSDVLIGKNHHIYLIDNSQMFLYFPTKSSIREWLEISAIRDKKATRRIFAETARRISSLDQEWYPLCKIPAGYHVDELWDIKRNIAETIRIAKELVSLQ